MTLEGTDCVTFKENVGWMTLVVVIGILALDCHACPTKFAYRLQYCAFLFPLECLLALNASSESSEQAGPLNLPCLDLDF